MDVREFENLMKADIEEVFTNILAEHEYLFPISARKHGHVKFIVSVFILNKIKCIVICSFLFGHISASFSIHGYKWWIAYY